MTVESFTNGIAIGAVTSPLWLKSAATVAGDILPILGAVWLIVQIAHKIQRWSDERRDAE